MKNRNMPMRSLPYLISALAMVLSMGIAMASCMNLDVADDIAAASALTETPGSLLIKTLSMPVHFTEIWQSEEIGQVTCIAIEDIKGNGAPEIIVGTMTGFDAGTYTYYGHVYIFNALTHELEWKSDDIGYVRDLVVADLDNNGNREIVAQTYRGRSARIGDCYGYIHVFDGLTRQQMWKSDNLGQPDGLVVTDLGGDGIKDIIVGAMHYYSCTRKGHIYVFDGLDFTIKWKSPDVHYPGSIVVDDVSGDGVQEIVFGNCITDCTSSSAEGGFYYPGHVYVIDGADFTQKWKSESIGFPLSLLTVDLDGDGTKEIVAGVQRTSYPNTDPDRGHIYVFDGQTYVLKWSSPNVNYPYGLHVTDMEDDGARKIIARTLTGHAIYSGIYEGHVYVFDGETFSQLWKSRNLSVDACLQVADLNSNGVKEILTRDTLGGGGYLCVFNGATYEEEWRSENIGRGALVVADLNSNGLKEIIAGGGSVEDYQGRLHIFASSAGPEPSQYSLIISSTDGGSVTQPGEGTYTYEDGNVVNLVATPAMGHHFVNWTGDVGTVGTVDSASTTITMNGDYSIVANFEPVAGVQTLCVESATGTGEVCITTSDGFIEDLEALPSIPPTPPADIVFPHGMFSFKVTGLELGQTVTITVELPDPVRSGTRWWKAHMGAWYSIPVTVIEPNVISFTLTDGVFPGDSDKTVDGVIIDPGGPGYPLPPEPFVLPDYVVGLDGSPLSKQAVMMPWIALLVAVAAGASLLGLLRRTRGRIATDDR